MKANKVDNLLLSIIVFLTFLGFYAILLLSISAGMSRYTRQVTIPIRVIIGVSCLILYIKAFKNKAAHLKWFALFVIIYLTRVFFDFIKGEYFYIEYSHLVFYFLSFIVIPFLSLSKLDYSKINILKLYNVFLFSSLTFSLLSILLYGRFIGEVGRLNTSTAGEDVISPLILSYCGSLIIGVSSTYLIYNRKEKKAVKYLSIISILLAAVPFFLGASRGSLFAIFFPFVILFLIDFSIKNIFSYTFLFIILIVGIVYLDNYFGSGLLDRFLGTTEAIETGSSSASRIGIWKKSFSQFLYHPFFGDKLNTEGVNHYPHNIYIEVLQTTGIIGFIPFIFLILKGIIASIRIFKKHLVYAWIPIFFLQAMMQNMFSGALYTGAWFWTSLALVIGIDMWLNKVNIK